MPDGNHYRLFPPVTAQVQFKCALFRRGEDRRYGFRDVASHELASMRLYELAHACWLYATLTELDSSTTTFQHATSPACDLANAGHRKALLVWLNSWGCRQFAKSHHYMASQALVGWGRRYLERLPHETARLVDLPAPVLDSVADAYGDLKENRASLKVRKSRSWAVTFGPTGAAKVLYALRPNVFPPWDEAIRKHFGYDGSVASYRQFLGLVQQEIRGLEEEAGHFGIPPANIPAAVGRPGVSLPKLVDEYYWVTVSEGFIPPTREELERWTRWA